VAQFGRPISDVSIGPWTDNLGGTTNLWSVLDDNSDTDYIEDLNGGNGTYEANLTSLTDPGVDTGHIIRFRMQGTGSGGPERLTVQLWQGTTSQIATLNNQTSRGSWATKTYNITEAEAANITDYTDLNIKLISSNLGGTEDMWCAWVELEIPDAASTDPISGTIAGSSSTVANIFGRGVISGTIAGGSSTVADIFGRGIISGTIAGGSSTLGDIFGRGIVSGIVAGNSTISGNIVNANQGTDPISGTIAGSSSTLAVIFGRGVLSGIIAGTSSTVASIFGRGSIGGTIAGSSSTVGDIFGRGVVSGTIAGSSSTVADIFGRGSVSGTIVGGSSIVANIYGLGIISGTITGGSSVSGNVEDAPRANLSGIIAGSSLATANIYGLGIIKGTILSSSSVSGKLVRPPLFCFSIAAEDIRVSLESGMVQVSLVANNAKIKIKT